MKAPKQKRIILITRKTRLQILLEQYGTTGQLEFYMREQASKLQTIYCEDQLQNSCMLEVKNQIPQDCKRVYLDRSELDKFLFAKDDLVVIIGQDGLVANSAKYLDGQFVIGINPDPSRFIGSLCHFKASELSTLLAAFGKLGNTESPSSFKIEKRTMAKATLDNGQSLLSLNELFIGHCSHQSARYCLRDGSSWEFQSSSGIICSTGTGSSGWAKSIATQRNIKGVNKPMDPRLSWFVREPYASVATAINMNFGFIEKDKELIVESQMELGGVIFADGIESDFLAFQEGQVASIGKAGQQLSLVVQGQ